MPTYATRNTMKKTLLIPALLAASGLIAQQNTSWTPPQLTPAQQNASAEISDVPGGTGETPSQLQINQGSNYSNASRAINETVIGNTKYDLQTNTAVQRRIVNHGNGDISAVWTYSPDNTWATRGTGYNFFDGTSWGAQPTSTVESIRTGWPNLGVAGGNELVIAHDPAADQLIQNDRSTIGSGAWNETVLSSLEVSLWTKMAVGGPGNNTVHMIGLTTPTTVTFGPPGVPYNGLDGALLYYRSLNGGQTWDIVDLQLPMLDSVHYVGIDADAYSIDAHGSTIAIVVADLGNGVQLWKSTDNGVNWTRTSLVSPPALRFDDNTTMIPAVFDSAWYGSDGTCHVLVDQNDNAHVWFGRMFITNATLGDGLIGYYPFQNGIEYWNETWGDRAPLTIAGALDLNGNGAIDIPDQSWLANYRFNGLAGYPTAGIDGSGNLYMTYTAVKEDADNLAQKYRRIYGTMSTDGGCTWSVPIDLTSDVSHDFDECVYPSMARNVDNKVHLVYQRDFEPGLAVNGDEDPVVTNDILYLSADVTDFSSTPGVCAHGITSNGTTTFCAGDSVTLEAYCGQSYSWSTGATSQSIQVTAYGQYILSTTTGCGVLTDTIDLTAPLTGPSINVSGSNGLELCPGDSTTLTASTTATSVTYLWSTGSTAASTLVTATGTYTVSATDCGGTTIQNITVGVPGPPSTNITGPSTVCAGQTYTLTVTPVSGGSYVWFNGATGNTITLTDTTGVFPVNVSNCGGSTVVSFSVGLEPAPTPSVSANGGLEFCDGESVTLTGVGGQTYRWSGPNGFSSTTGAIILNQIAQSGDYFLTAYSACGDSATTGVATSVTVNPLPAVPSISYSNGTYTSSATSGNQWAINGTLVAGEIQKTFTPTGNTSGALVTVTVTDGNGCTSEGSITSVNEVNASATAFNLYPNPNDGRFTLKFTNAENDNYTVEVKNLLGQVVYTQSLKINGNTNHNIDLSTMGQGVYLLTVRTESSETSSRVIVR